MYICCSATFLYQTYPATLFSKPGWKGETVQTDQNQSQWSCRRTMRPFSIHTHGGHLIISASVLLKWQFKRLPRTAHITGSSLVTPCIHIRLYNTRLLSRSVFFYYLFGAASSSATPGLSENTGSAACTYRNDCNRHALRLLLCSMVITVPCTTVC